MEAIQIGAGGIETIEAPVDMVEKADQQVIAEAAKIANANDILAMLAPSNDVIVLEREIEVAGVMQTFYIKQLSYAESSKLEAKKYRRGQNQQLVRDPDHEQTVALAWQIHTCVLTNKNAGKKDENGEDLPPKWEELFTLEQVLGGGKKIGLMSNPNEAAQVLIYSLGSAVWEVNSSLNPLAAAAAAQQLGLT